VSHPDPVGPRPTADRLERRERGVFVALVAVSILPLWSAHRVPTMDGPIHLYVLELLRSFLTDGDASPYGLAFEWSGVVDPNLGFYLLGFPLALVFPLPWVEKLVLSAAVAAFAFGAAALARASGAPRWSLATLFVPLATHHFVYQGFHNYTVGMAAAVVAVALAVARPPAWHARRLLGYALATTLLLAAHLTALAAFGLYLGCHLIGVALGRAVEERRVGPALRELAARAGALAMASAPALLLALAFLVRQGASTAVPVDDSLRSRVADLVWLTWLTAFETLELAWLAPFALLLVALATLATTRMLRRPAFDLRRGLPPLVAAIGLIAIALVGFGNARDVGIAGRLTPLVAVAGVTWLAVVLRDRRTRVLALVAVTAVVAVDASYRVLQHLRYGATLEAYIELTRHAPVGATLLGVKLDEASAALIDPRWLRPTFPLRHAAALSAIDRRGIYLGATLLSEARFGYFPVRYRRDVDPFPRIGAHEAVPPDLDLEGYAASGGLRVDAVVVVGAPDPAETRRYLTEDAPWATAFRIAASDPGDRLQLLLRTDPPP
jgi:hypothetical protein